MDARMRDRARRIAVRGQRAHEAERDPRVVRIARGEPPGHVHRAARVAGGKRNAAGREGINPAKAYAIDEAVKLIKERAKAKFEGKSVSISCPSVVIGPGHTVTRPSNTPCVSIPCKTAFGDFCIDVSIRPENAAKAVESGPKRRIQGEPAAEGGATISAPAQPPSRGRPVA